jgi:hypothetical protein
MSSSSKSKLDLEDPELLDAKLDRLNSKVHSLMQGLATIEDTDTAPFDLCSRFNGLVPIDDFAFTDEDIRRAEVLSDISETPTTFEYSFIEHAAQQQLDFINRAVMQVEDFRSHELRDEEQMLSFDEFVELSNQVNCCNKRKELSPQGPADSLTSGNSVDCEALTQGRAKLDRDFDELNSKLCCMRLQGSDVSKFSVMMEESQRLLTRLGGEVDKVKKTNTCLVARTQQLEIQKERTRAYQDKLKAKMQLVRAKDKLLQEKEEKLRLKEKADSQLALLKLKLSKVVVDGGRTLGGADAEFEGESSEGLRRFARSNTVKTLAAQEKVNRILEECQRQNKTFKALMPKLSNYPTLIKGNQVSPVKSSSSSSIEARAQGLTEQIFRREHGRFDQGKAGSDGVTAFDDFVISSS